MTSSSLISISAGKKLKDFRVNAGYKITTFANLTNRSEQQLMRYENGATKIDLETLFLYIKVLDINICEFINELFTDFKQKEGELNVQEMQALFNNKSDFDGLFIDMY